MRVAQRLATVADVIVENFSSSVMRRLKLDYDTLHRDNPRLDLRQFVRLRSYRVRAARGRA